MHFQLLQVGVDIDISHMLVTCLKMKLACQTFFPLGHMPFKDNLSVIDSFTEQKWQEIFQWFLLGTPKEINLWSHRQDCWS